MSDQQQADLLAPTGWWHEEHLCYTSLQEFRQRQQKPEQRNGKRSTHQVLEAHP